MKKKMILSLIGVTTISLGLSTAAPVLAAETGTQSTTETGKTSNSTNKPEGEQSKTSGATDTSKTPTETKPNNDNKKPAANKKGSNIGKALPLINKYVKLTKNSYVYNKKGKRIRNLKLKKGTVVLITGFTNVKNKDLLSYVDSNKSKKNRYVKMNNVKYFKAVQYKLKKKGFVYNAKGEVRRSPNGGRYYIKKGKIVTVFKIKKIKGVKFVGLDDNVYIKWSALDPKSYHVVQ